MALSQGADLLILDEPATALDPVSVDQLSHVLAEDGLDRGCTIFFSSHQLEEVERIAICRNSPRLQRTSAAQRELAEDKRRVA
jgi:ABC-type multidrug transport system ATPase subunit